MHSFSFEAFDLAPGNRAAYDAARGIANGTPPVPMPLLIVGPPGAGKSHLLWSIVKQVRGGARRVGLALVMAHEFPDKVRALAHNPAPIAGRPAILLVDDLDAFDGTLPDLEAVVRVFLELGHPVAVAAAQPPERLPRLEAGFKALLEAGTVIGLEPRRAAAAAPPPEDLSVAEAWRELDAVRRERDDLDRALRDMAALKAENESLSARLEHSQAEEDRLNRALAEASALAARAGEEAKLRARIAALETGIGAAERERDALRTQLAAGARTIEELDRARAQTAAVQAELERAYAEHARLQGLAGAARRAQEDAERARLEAQAMADGYRIQWEQAQGDYREGAERARAQIAQLESMLEDAHADRGRTQVAHDTLCGRLEGAEFELEKARKQLALQMAEMDALREAAATQVATVTVHAGGLERRVAELEAALETAQRLGLASRQESERVAGEFDRMAAAVRGLTTRFAVLPKIAPPAPGGPTAIFHEPDLFESLPGA